MPTQKQITVQPNTVIDKPFGSRSDTSLKAAFPTSPIHSSVYTDESVHVLFEKLALRGDVASSGGSLAGRGYGFNSFNRDFIGSPQDPVPDLNDVNTGGGGLPASPYVPDLSSPGDGEGVNASAKPGYDIDNLVNSDPKGEFGSGLGGLVSPSETSPQIAEQSIIGSYISGRSFQGSDGQP